MTFPHITKVLFELDNMICLSIFKFDQDELEAKYWEGLANADLFKTFHRKDINRKAKNVILFIGGGMGLSTITPARILKGQLKNSPGEEAKLTFEEFPNTCLLKVSPNMFKLAKIIK